MPPFSLLSKINFFQMLFVISFFHIQHRIIPFISALHLNVSVFCILYASFSLNLKTYRKKPGYRIYTRNLWFSSQLNFCVFLSVLYDLNYTHKLLLCQQVFLFFIKNLVSCIIMVIMISQFSPRKGEDLCYFTA